MVGGNVILGTGIPSPYDAIAVKSEQQTLGQGQPRVCKCVHGTAAVRYGERQRPEHRSCGHMIDAQVADAPRTVPLAVLYTHLQIAIILRPNHSAVSPSSSSPTVIEIGRPFREWEFRREFLVYFHAEAGLLLSVHIAVLHFRTANEDLLRVLLEDRALVDAEVVAGQFERKLRRMSHGRSVAGAVPGRADAEELRERLNLARRTESSDLRNVDSDEVYQPVFDQRHVFMLRVEQFAHRQRRRGLLAQQPEMIVLFRRERVFEEEEAMPFDVFTELYRLCQSHALMHVVQQFNLLAEFRPQMIEQFGEHPDVRGRFPDRVRVRVGRADGFGCRFAAAGGSAARAVGRQAWRRDLYADVAVAHLHPAPRVFLDLLEVASAGVEIEVGAETDLTAEQLIERHVRAFALDVPQRDVHAAHRVEERRAVAPVRAHIRRLPDVLDFVHVATDQKWLQILLDRSLDDVCALSERCASPPMQARLGRLDFDDDQSNAVGRGQDRCYVSDFDGRQTFTRGLLLRCLVLQWIS